MTDINRSVKHAKPNITLTEANNGQNVPCVDANFFCNISENSYVDVNLPDPSVMSGHSITFTYVTFNSESGITLNGTIGLSDTTFSMNYPQSVTFLSDGSTWWITAAFSSY